MFYVYILFSTSKSKYYIGQTSDIENRLNRHNSGFSLSTKYGIPWELVQTFMCETRSDAILLEKKIKKRGAKRQAVKKLYFHFKIYTHNLYYFDVS